MHDNAASMEPNSRKWSVSGSASKTPRILFWEQLDEHLASQSSNEAAASQSITVDPGTWRRRCGKGETDESTLELQGVQENCLQTIRDVAVRS
jgi:hypothetical protein